MLFSEDFQAHISQDPVSSVLEICRLVRNNLEEDPDGWTPKDYEVLLEAFALLSSLEEIGMISSDGYIPEIEGVWNRDCNSIFQYIGRLEDEYKAEESKLKLQTFKSRFKTNLGAGFCYEFSQGDLDRIQVLINELRQNISTSDKFEPDHQRRMLVRLERLQAELHKKMSSLDLIYGVIGDAGVVIGKFGEDVKPIVDRLREIVEIAWRTQARAEELPSDMPLPKLEDKSEQGQPQETEVA